MSKSKQMSIVLGLAILLAPIQVSSSSQTVDVSMEEDIHTSKEEKIKEIEFISTMAEMSIETKDNKKYIGKFTITHYCSCKKCNGKWADMPAANGENLQEGYTIAVDPSVIPLNSVVEIDGYGIRKAQDTGSAIKGNKIDIFIDNHEECYMLGKLKDIDVYLLKED